MSFFGTMNISATGLSAQRARMDVHAQNLANVDTTRTPDGGPYQRRAVIFEERDPGGLATSFAFTLNQAINSGGRRMVPGQSLAATAQHSVNRAFASRGMPISVSTNDNTPVSGRGVRIHSIATDDSDGPRVYDPMHPDADVYGYVMRPNVNVIAEMVNMISASRSYEANMTAIGVTQGMMQRTLEMSGR